MSTAMGNLDSIKVLVIRPDRQLADLCHAIEIAGGIPVPLPLLDIVGPSDAKTAKFRLEEGRRAALWIFTSPNAVAWSLALSPPLAEYPWPYRLAAVGQGTANALRKHAGARNVLVPSADGAEALLNLAELQNIAGNDILIIRGERPLPLLEERLHALGAIVQTAEVYRRMQRPTDPDAIARAIAEADAAIVTSSESLRILRCVTPAALLSRLLALQLVVPSARVVKVAMEMGFERQPLLPERVSDDEFVRALLRWNGQRSPGDQP